MGGRKRHCEGDRVIAVPPDGMGSYASIDARWVARAPEAMSPAEAVSGTCVYATAWLGLHWMARTGTQATCRVCVCAFGRRVRIIGRTKCIFVLPARAGMGSV